MRPRLPALLILTIVTCAMVGGCGDRRSEQELVADATQKLAAGKLRGAIIDLRNALRDNPDNVQARVALAGALIDTGDVAASDKELQRAIRLGAPEASYYRTYGRILHERGEHAEVIAEIDPAKAGDPALASELTAMRARAMVGLGSFAEADRIFTDVLGAGLSVEAQRIALLGKSSIAADRGDLASAARLAGQSFELAPDSAESFLRVGQLAIARDQYAEAVTHLSDENARGVRMNQNERFRMQTERATALIRLGEYDAAAEAAEAMATLAPKHPMPALLLGQIEFQRGNLGVAMEKLLELNAKSPNFAPGQALLGAVSLEQGDVAQAEAYLRNALRIDPTNAMARRLIAEMQLRSSRPEEALAMLQSGLRGNEDNPQLLAKLGRAAIQTGDEDLGMSYLRRSLENDPDNVEAKLTLIGALIGDGTNEARNEAIALAESLPVDAIGAGKKDMLVAVASFDRQNPGPAKARLERVLAQSPNDASLHTIAGNFYSSIGDLDAARAQFERVVELRPDEVGAALNILRIDNIENDFSRSRALFQSAREQRPRDALLLLALAEIAQKEGRREDEVALAREAHTIDDTRLLPNLILASDAMDRNDLDEAESFARSALASHPNSAKAHGAVGIVQARRGLHRDAAVSLRRAIELSPDVFQFHYQLGRALRDSDQQQEARASFARALELEGAHYDTLRSLASLEAKLGNDAAADALLEKARKNYGAGALLDRLTGEIRFEQGRLEESLAAFAAAYKTVPSWPLAAQMYIVRLNMESPDALSSINDWIAANPNHASSRLTLAQHYEKTDQNEKAIEQYEILRDRGVESPMILNNLAWLYFQSGGDPSRARALEMAERAHQLLPRNFDIADTLGWIQFKSGQTEAGIETLRAALAATTPKRSPEIAYHLAAALKARGADNEARETLLQALSSTELFPSRDEAQRLFDSM